MSDILSLTGKEFDRELDRIIKSSPQRKRFWTEKEDLVVKRLYEAGLDDFKIAESVGRSKHAVRARITVLRRK